MLKYQLSKLSSHKCCKRNDADVCCNTLQALSGSNIWYFSIFSTLSLTLWLTMWGKKALMNKLIESKIYEFWVKNIKYLLCVLRKLKFATALCNPNLIRFFKNSIIYPHHCACINRTLKPSILFCASLENLVQEIVWKTLHCELQNWQHY